MIPDAPVPAVVPAGQMAKQAALALEGGADKAAHRAHAPALERRAGRDLGHRGTRRRVNRPARLGRHQPGARHRRNPVARGAGVALEAVRRAADWAMNELGLHRLRLCHSVANPASCRVAEKAGYTFEGTMRSALLHADRWHDQHLHALVRGDT
ncbi:GNAT family N-acetyltransferase [Streptacidiphilus sp. MAP5-52]|uniref:GNAT family N-acetyltransferase n=1 Tax=Streptacidiphilus sp. MAP5-52 TaxID=3156267 RepID=UPI003517F4A5